MIERKISKILRVADGFTDPAGRATRLFPEDEETQVDTPVTRMGRTPEREHTRRRKAFIVRLAAGDDPITAAKRSGHPAEKALATLSELGFKLTSLEAMDKAA